MKKILIIPSVLVATVMIAGSALANATVQADSTATANAAIIVPSSCNFTGTVDTPHTAEIPASQYKANIGKTTFNVTCNDSGGFAIYAVGYSGAEFGNNKLLATIGGTLNPTYDIATGTATSGSTSNWAMKLTAVSGAYTPTIENSFNAYKGVPSTYTKVALFGSVTDSTNGASVEATYAAYIAGDQPAGTYNGKVRYTMVHPASETPAQPQATQSGKICYYANASDAVGSMGCQDVAALVTLLASNFSRTGYGFAGWSTAYDYSDSTGFYGPNETIALNTADYSSPNNGLSLYAYWIKSAGSLQGWTGCPSLQSGAVTALSDQRDDNTYAVAKLADGNCWMIENMRLENTNSDNATGTLAQGYNTSFAGLADPEAASLFSGTATANTLYSTDGSTEKTISGSNQGYRFPRYNNVNTPTTVTDRPSNPTTNSSTNSTSNAGMYSYGNYYTWAAAIADTTAYTSDNTSVANTSICPTGWHLPTGGLAYASGSTSGVNVTGDTNTFREFYNLGYKTMDEVKTAYEDTPDSGYAYYSSNTTNTAGKTATAAFRSFPNNFVYSGFVVSSSVSSRGSGGYYWSSTARSSSNAYYLYLNPSSVNPGTSNNYKYNGRTVRCVAPGA